MTTHAEYMNQWYHRGGPAVDRYKRAKYLATRCTVREMREERDRLAAERGCALDDTHAGPYEWDHIVPRFEGGLPRERASQLRSWPAQERFLVHPNIRVLCRRCNRDWRKAREEV